MNILSIDTSSNTLSIAIKSNDEILGELDLNSGLVHSTTLMPAMEYLFKLTGFDKKDLDLVAVCIGPGSFTGIRIGVATANAMALGLGIKVVGVSSLKVLAMNHRYSDAIIIPTVDAQRESVYTCIYETNDGTLTATCEEKVVKIENLIEYIKGLDKNVVLSGYLLENLEDYKLNNLITVSPEDNFIKASNICILAEKQYLEQEKEQQAFAQPKYIQKSQAEEVYEKKFGEQNKEFIKKNLI